MGLRFSRRIRIAKGFNLNLSKSGIGVSVGPRGAKVSLGPSGIYTHAGIPGTGIAFRQKVGLNSKGSSPFIQSGFQVSTRIIINEHTAEEIIEFLDSNGNVITDESIIRKVKRLPAYKAELESARTEAFEKAWNNYVALFEIHKHCEECIKKDDLEKELNSLKLEKYIRKTFSINKPETSDAEDTLREEAKKAIKSWKLWSLPSMRKKWVADRTQKKYEEMLEAWNMNKKAFEEQETKKEVEENCEFTRQYQYNKNILMDRITGSKQHISSTLENKLSELKLPFEYDISYEIGDGEVILDVDLPEIKDYPLFTPNRTSTGKFSMKKKTQKLIKEDYAKSTLGLAFYLASIVFNISPAIKSVRVLGYTQRADKKTGEIKDDYVYSIDFTAEQFSSLMFESINPIESVKRFNHLLELTSSFDMKTVDVDKVLNQLR